MDHLGLLRSKIDSAKPRRYDPNVRPNRPLEHGWLLPYLLLADDLTWKRWNYWFEMMQAQRVVGNTIPQIEWCSNPHARKMLENSLNSITRYGGWQGWGSWQFFEYFMDWLLFGFGHGGHKVPPKEPLGAEGASDRLYQVFNIETLLAYPHDYFGDILAENQHGRRSGFFPTPMNVVEILVRMTVDGDARQKTICDPCVGTGRMLLVASNYSFRLYGTLKRDKQKIMSTAFEITSEDVRNVMEANGRPVNESTAEKLFKDTITPEDGRIEKAALYGNEMEEQTEYAYQEIAQILREAGVLT